MHTAQLDTPRPDETEARTDVPFRLEGIVIPVADFDRAKGFYVGLGWRLDAEIDSGDGYRLMQLTPPGSKASVLFGTRVTEATPGSFDGLLLVVDDIDDARDALLARGVDVSEVFHDVDGGLGGGFHIGDTGRAPGHDPQRRSYASYASFLDSEGNRWVLQEITTRLPGRVDEGDLGATPPVAALADLLRETSEQHDAFEKAAPAHDWWDWYAPYLDARRRGSSPQQAAHAAAEYLADVKHVVVG